jgi:hypothetical protein
MIKYTLNAGSLNFIKQALQNITEEICPIEH